MTPNQSRDLLIESGLPLDSGTVQVAANMARHCTEDRKIDADIYVRCPRCYGYHSVHGNFDNLCDSCQQTILRHFPNHESVPFIKKALERWSPKEQT